MKLDTENKVLILDECDLMKILEFLKFKPKIGLNVQEDDISPIVPIGRIEFVRVEGDING